MVQVDHPLADLYARPEPGARRAVGDDYESPAGRSRKARWLIGLTIAVNAVSVLLLGAQRSLLDRGPGNISPAEWNRSDARIGAAGLVELLLFVVAVVLFLRWLHRCYRNLVELDTENMRFTPGWAVGYWFIPILNLWRPKQILDDLWRGTDARADTGAGAWRSLPSTGLVATWWALDILAGVTSYAASRWPTSTFADLQHRNSALIVGHLLQIAAGACLFVLVGLLTAREDARAAARNAAATPVSVPAAV